MVRSSSFLLSVLASGFAACASAPPLVPSPETSAPPVAAPAHALSPVPPGELRRPATYSMLAVLLPEGRTPEDVVRAIAEAARAHERSLTTDTQELLTGAILVDVTPVDRILRFELIDFDSLHIPPEEAAAIKRSPRAVSMVMAGPAEQLALIQRQAADIARAAVAGGGWLFDGGTFQVFTAARFDEFRPAGFPLEVERLVTVMVDDSQKNVRLETLGMERLGLPELRMLDVPPPLVDGAIALFNAAAQVVVEQAFIEQPGELVIDLRHARLPHLRELHEEATRVGGGHPITLTAHWDPTARPEDSDPVIRLDLVTSSPDRPTAFSSVLRRLFGDDLTSESRATRESSREARELR